MLCVSTPTYSILVNGEARGFFPGKRGLRQGDHLSPFLFILVMEMFSRKLIKASKKKGFYLHPKCKQIGLISMDFADDLLIFCKPTNSTLKIIKDCIMEFGEESRLITNASKSKVFIGGVIANAKSEIASFLGFDVGCFLVRYLRTPLHSKKLKTSDYSALISRVTSIIQRRNVGSLSYPRHA